MVETRSEIAGQLKKLPNDVPKDKIALTREHLERRSFTPSFLLPVKNFLSMDREALEQELDRVLGLEEEYLLSKARGFSDDPQKIRCAQINLLLYYYDLIARLRLDIPEAWDEIHDLYEDD